MSSDAESLVWWLTKKVAPFLLFGLLLGLTLGFLRSKAPDVLQIVLHVTALLFGGFALLYFYWAIRPGNAEDYHCSRLEKLGIASSGSGALLIACKLGFPASFPGPLSAYFVVGFLLAFVLRPLLENLTPLPKSDRRAHRKRSMPTGTDEKWRQKGDNNP